LKKFNVTMTFEVYSVSYVDDVKTISEEIDKHRNNIINEIGSRPKRMVGKNEITVITEEV
jgi:hypothetical protein